MPLEIEVKFYLGPKTVSRVEISRRIEAMGGRSEGRVFERNIRFEDAAGSLLARRSLLRLREDGRTRLTFKSESPGLTDRDRENFKIFEELEVEVSDFFGMARILEALGFRQAQVYEKWRETFMLGESQICLDTMPFGEFLEIEGPRAAIPGLAAGIGLDWDRRILDNYLGIFAHLRAAAGLPFNDITFEQFKGLPEGVACDDLSPYIRQFEYRHRR